MLVVFFILLDLCMFSVLSIPIYSLFCAQSFVTSVASPNILISTVCVNYIFRASAVCGSVVTFSGSAVAYYTLLSVFYTFNVECICSFWYFVPSLIKAEPFYRSSILQIALYVRRSNLGILEFYTLQSRLHVIYDEITLAFFRVYNPTHYTYTSLFVYLVYPMSVSAYVNKVQCFCFECLIVRPLETFDLPVLFFIGSELQGMAFFVLDKLAFLYVLFLI